MEQQPFDNYNPNLMPTVARIQRAGAWLLRKLSIYPDGADIALSEHYKGADVATQDQLPFER